MRQRNYPVKEPIKQHPCPKNHITGILQAMGRDAGAEIMVDAVATYNV